MKKIFLTLLVFIIYSAKISSMDFQACTSSNDTKDTLKKDYPAHFKNHPLIKAIDEFWATFTIDEISQDKTELDITIPDVTIFEEKRKIFLEQLALFGAHKKILVYQSINSNTLENMFVCKSAYDYIYELDWNLARDLFESYKKQ